MKKTVKILSIVLALVIVIGCFAACGDKKNDTKAEKPTKAQTEETVTGEKLLVGAWKTHLESEGYNFPLVLTFKDDGTAFIEFSRDGYEEFINSAVEQLLEEEGFNNFTDEQKEHFVHVDSMWGLTDEHVQLAINILNHENI